MSRTIYFVTSLLIAILISADSAFAYVGPGAGFAFLGSAFVFILAFAMAFVTFAFWPLQFLYRLILGKRISKNARTKRVVIVGLDGLEPKLVDKFLEEGLLPNFKALSEEGGFSRLGTTTPAISPVAWSTFQTGVNPGAHNIFDFLTRDKRYCLPDLSSTQTIPSKKNLTIGKYQIPLGRPQIKLMRKSRPFWKILGKYGIFSNILRVPISYPPEKFHGNILSAMCTPDLKGTQGSFCVYTTREKNAEVQEGGEIRRVKLKNNVIVDCIEGPPNPFRKELTPLKVPFKLTLNKEKEEALLEIGDESVILKKGEVSGWVKLKFKFGFRKSVEGLCRFCVRELGPDFFMYVSPININPEKPALPISEPVVYSTYLAKNQGLFGTLGLMEDTWARNEQAIDDKLFLDQTWLTHNERETMFFNALKQTREGVCACVFDASDRIQHMFWRNIDDQHPAPTEDNDYSDNAIRDMYIKMDDLVGRVKEKVNPEDVLIVMSDHGFTSFRRCVNLNTWLMQEGYLTLKEGAEPDGDYFRYVDWSKTKAFCVGMAGIYLNRIGREVNGIVDDEEAGVLKAEISEKLMMLHDPKEDRKVVRRVYDAMEEYSGIYASESADIIIGFERGYRVSWEAIVGGIKPEVFEDNLKAWSGDHDVDPELVPGVLFSNWKVKHETPHIADIAPTVLNLFAVPVPGYMEGKVVL